MSLLFTLYILYLWMISALAMALPIHIHHPHFHAPTLPAWDMRRGADFDAWVGATRRDREDGERSGRARAVDVRVGMTKGGKNRERKKEVKKLGVVVTPSPGIQCVVM